MSVPAAETRLKAGNIDAMQRIERDSVTVNSTPSADSIIDNDNW
jgi:hypothetical protein